MGAKYNNGIVGNLIELLNENGATITEVIDNKPVVDNLVANVNRATKNLKCTVYNIDCPINTSSEATRVSQQYIHSYSLLTFPRTL
jgi:t-SNARE complex subunit (syntaxin)